MTRYSPLWQQAGSYAASVDRYLMATLWPTGAIGGGAVTAVANTMTVSVAAGTVAVVLQAGQGVALCRWDAPEVPPALAAAPPAGQSRIDLIVAQVRDNALDGGANNDFVFQVVTGTAATTGSQVAPAVPTNAYALASVLVGPSIANLNSAPITTLATTWLPAARDGARYCNVAGTLAMAAGTTLIPLPTRSYDTRGNPGLYTASGLQVPTAGLWKCCGEVELASNGTHFLFIGVNGTERSRGQRQPLISGGAALGLTVSDTLLLNANDVVSLNVYSSIAGATLTNTPSANFLSVSQ